MDRIRVRINRVIIALFLFIWLAVSNVIYHGVFAESTYQYSRVILNPFYIQSLVKNTDYNFSFKFNPPDGYNQTVSAIISFDVLVNPPTSFTLKINGTSCTPTKFDVAGTMAVKGEVNIAFDCSNNIMGIGNYIITLRSDDDTGFIYGWVDFVYQNIWTVGGLTTGGTIDVVGEVKNPVSSFEQVRSIGGTEYSSHESARILLQILDAQGLPVIDNNCFTTIRDSLDNVKINNQTLSFINGSNGLYYYQFMTSLPVGVYSVDSYCDVNGTKIYSGDTFHVADWTQDIIDIYNATTSHFIGFVGGTEYMSDETVNIRVQYLKAGTDGGTPVNNECCNFNLFAPNLTQIFTEQSMTYIPNSRGLYYYDWTNFNKEVGVYSIDVNCYNCNQPSSWRAYSGSTFHVWKGKITDANASFYELRYSSGTEYQPSQYGQVSFQFLRTVAGSPNPVNDGDCNATVWYPNNTVFLDNVGMTYLSDSHGLYYYGFYVPDVDGLYKVNANCTRRGVKTFGSSSFHVTSSWNINTTGIMDKLYSIQDDLADLSDMLDTHDSRVMDKLYSIQDDVSNITDTLVSHNTTVMNKLYKIQDEIASINITCANITIPNITCPKYLNCSEVGFCTIEAMLHESTILKKKLSNHNYCSPDNSTLIHNITYEHCGYFGCINHSEIQEESCRWGCDPNEMVCKKTPTWSILIVLGIVILILVLIIVFRRYL